MLAMQKTFSPYEVFRLGSTVNTAGTRCAALGFAIGAFGGGFVQPAHRPPAEPRSTAAMLASQELASTVCTVSNLKKILGILPPCPDAARSPDDRSLHRRRRRPTTASQAFIGRGGLPRF